VFLGTYTPKLDDKGRLTLPAKFRDALAGGVMVSKGQDFSLAVYTAADFAERSRKLTAASRANPKARAYVRQFFSGTDEQGPDRRRFLSTRQPFPERGRGSVGRSIEIRVRRSDGGTTVRVARLAGPAMSRRM